MQVLTLDPSAFDRHATLLAQMVAENDLKIFDALVAIRRGGSFVCDAFCMHFPKDRYDARYDVTLQRPSTRHKTGAVNRLLKYLPTGVLDAMRITESNILSLLRKVKGKTPAPEVELPDGLTDSLQASDRPHILLIDDAIDSGDTLFAIVTALKGINPQTEIRIAVMTETTTHPRIHADFTLYQNKTLIRFPWSNDYKHR